MSGWIKIDKHLIETIRFRRVVRKLRDSSNALRGVTENTEAFAVTVVLGALVRFWIYADSHIRDDDSLDIALDEINEIVGVDGFAQALPTEWLEVIDTDHVKLPNFHEHNGSSEKLRRDNARRQAEYRHRHQLHNVTRDVTVTNKSNDARPDQTREDKTRKRSAPSVPTWFAEFRLAYPPRAGSQRWRDAERAANSRLAEGHVTRELIDGAIRYARYCQSLGKLKTEFVLQAATFLGPNKQFLEPWDLPETPATLATERRQQADTRALAELKTRAERIGFRQFNPAVDDLVGYRTLVERAESNLPRRASS